VAQFFRDTVYKLLERKRHSELYQAVYMYCHLCRLNTKPFAPCSLPMEQSPAFWAHGDERGEVNFHFFIARSLSQVTALSSAACRRPLPYSVNELYNVVIYIFIRQNRSIKRKNAYIQKYTINKNWRRNKKK